MAFNTTVIPRSSIFAPIADPVKRILNPIVTRGPGIIANPVKRIFSGIGSGLFGSGGVSTPAKNIASLSGGRGTY